MKKLLLYFLLIVLSISSLLFVDVNQVEAASGYYASTEGLTGTELLNELATITQKNHTKFTSYDDIKTMNPKSDPDPNNSSKLLDFYSRISVNAAWDGGSTWNREHVWPQSQSGGLYGTSGAGSDIHHIRPTINSINSKRGNMKFTDFDVIGQTANEYKYNSQLVAYTNNTYWEPLDNVKGDTARIVMYMYMHYSKEVSANASFSKAGSMYLTNIVYGKGGSKDAALQILLYWNKLDPVDDYEANRNEYCASVTGTRNPFIDYPEFADAIWSNGTSIDPDDNIGGGNTTPDVDNPTNPDTPDNPTTSGSTATLVKSVNELKTNDKIVIAATESDCALGTTQNGNNRSQAGVTKSGDSLTFGSDTQVITLTNGTASNTYAFYVGDGYLYAAGGTGKNNYLRTETALTLAGSWNITISSNGVAKIVTADSTVVRNTLMHNTSASIFSCYASGQKDVSIYKVVEKEEHQCEIDGDYLYDSTYHWHECECGKVDNKETHEFTWSTISPATSETPEVLEGVCNLCGYKTTKTGSILSEHVYGEEWKYDETDHWHECECGEISEKAAHKYVVNPETGEILCKVCGMNYSRPTNPEESPEVDLDDVPSNVEDILGSELGCEGSIFASFIGLLTLATFTLVLRKKRK